MSFLTKQMRAGWDSIKHSVMYTALHAKFFQNNSLKRLLLSTGDHPLVFLSGDRYWGSGTDGRGRNEQGKILMSLRDQIRQVLTTENPFLTTLRKVETTEI